MVISFLLFHLPTLLITNGNILSIVTLTYSTYYQWQYPFYCYTYLLYLLPMVISFLLLYLPTLLITNGNILSIVTLTVFGIVAVAIMAFAFSSYVHPMDDDIESLFTIITLLMQLMSLLLMSLLLMSLLLMPLLLMSLLLMPLLLLSLL